MLEVAGFTFKGTTFLGPDGLADAVERDLLQTSRDIMQNIGIATVLTLRRVVDQIEGKHGGQWPLSGNAWGTAPDRLARRSGRGLESIRKSIRTEIDPIKPWSGFTKGFISTGSLTVHETGATVAPKRGRYLAIPLRAALTAQGLPIRARARDWNDTFITRTRRGNLIIAQRGAGETFTPLYLLARKAVIPPRLRMEETLNANLSYFKSKALDGLERAIIGRELPQ